MGALPRSDRAGAASTGVIGTSGTILSLGTLAVADDERHRAGGHPQPARPAQGAAPAAQAARRSGHRRTPAHAGPRSAPRRPRRSPARCCFDTIVRRLGADDLTLCDLALREGLVLDYIHRNSARIRKVERYPGRPPPQRHRARRALRLLAGARAAGRAARARASSTRRAACTGSSDREREWLEYGALLHDVGVHISYERHHRHSYYLIKNGDLRGFDRRRSR